MKDSAAQESFIAATHVHAASCPRFCFDDLFLMGGNRAVQDNARDLVSNDPRHQSATLA
jgi:hypothetical protein